MAESFPVDRAKADGFGAASWVDDQSAGPSCGAGGFAGTGAEGALEVREAIAADALFVDIAEFTEAFEGLDIRASFDFWAQGTYLVDTIVTLIAIGFEDAWASDIGAREVRFTASATSHGDSGSKGSERKE